MEKIKPCPFCGKEGHFGEDETGYFVECWASKWCGVTPDSPSYPTAEMAIEAWNQRDTRELYKLKEKIKQPLHKDVHPYVDECFRKLIDGEEL